ncbi:MAG: VanZ family protein [Solirubrobacterales bacterium]|nr:VanZ family protein [Solirubrobacterales bacterium]
MIRFLPPLALMVVIFLLSAQPDLSTGLGTWDLILRKLAHMGVFGLLAVLWYRALAPTTDRALVLAVLFTLLYAISDEYHQTFVAGRSGSPVDVGIDVVGIGLAVLLIRSGRMVWLAGPGETDVRDQGRSR